MNSIIYDNIKYSVFFGKVANKKKKRVNESKKKTLLFVVTRANVWNSVQSVYAEAKKREDINVYVITLPLGGKKTPEKTDLTNYKFFSAFEPNTINAYNENGEIFRFESLEPDCIVVSIPYEREYPEEYQFEKMAAVCPVCYVSYGYTMKASKMQAWTVRPAVVKNASYIFSCNSIMYKYYKKKMFLSELIFGKRLYNIGFPRFDIFANAEKNNNGDKQVIMWLPRWTSEQDVEFGNEPSSFFELKDKLVDFVAKQEKAFLIARPHPKAFVNYVDRGIMKQDDVDEYVGRLEQMACVCLDNGQSYYENFVKADILVADYTSMLAEFFVMNKPIIYLGTPLADHKDMYDSFYTAQNWNEVEKILLQLLSGVDEKKEERQRAVEKFWKKTSKNVGKEIVKTILGE